MGIEFEEGSGNVFADLGFEDAEDRLARARLGACVWRVVDEEGMGPEEVGARLGLSETEAGHLLDGHFNEFSTDALMGFLRKLGRKVTIRITPHRPGEPYHDIALGP